MSIHRFAVTGAQGTGKTTLTRELHQLCARAIVGECQLLQGIGQRIKSMGHPSGSNTTSETLCAFAAEHVKREREATGRVIIQDRCLLDLLSYARVLGHRYDALGMLLCEITITSILVIEKVFYLPITPGIQTTNVEVEDAEFRLKIDEEIRASAETLGLTLYPVEGSMEERLSKAFQLIMTTAC